MSKSYLATFTCDDETLEVKFETDAATVVELSQAAENALLALHPDKEPLMRAILAISDLKITPV